VNLGWAAHPQTGAEQPQLDWPEQPQELVAQGHAATSLGRGTSFLTYLQVVWS